MVNRKNRGVAGQVKWVPIRSRRDPAFWAPILLTVIILTPLVLWVHDYTTDMVAAVNTKTLSDPETYKELIFFIRAAVWSLSVVLIFFSVYHFRYCKVGSKEGRLPPSGWWSLGAWRAIVGARVRLMVQLGYAISLFLFLIGLGLIVAVEYLLVGR